MAGGIGAELTAFQAPRRGACCPIPVGPQRQRNRRETVRSILAASIADISRIPGGRGARIAHLPVLRNEKSRPAQARGGRNRFAVQQAPALQTAKLLPLSTLFPQKATSPMSA